jgi:hypothetical protein
MADLKGAVYELLESSDSPLSNAEIGRRLGIYQGHVGHEGHISRTGARARVGWCTPGRTTGWLKLESCVVVPAGIFGLRQEITKLCGFAAIQTRLTFANNLDHA